ncbi:MULTISPECIES: hypothetical protein [Streptomyces]|uniref:Uncharacterized protein n=1 Tax=Streptomyces lasiicapitis TaxID=1923961 RepID=A0ABQ2M952_9ACTN|nr:MULTISPECIES: hypothetical protein [Streptomyces]QIB42078.1 hypothetical protein G3H79_02255 [Streptomyces aureoverticillatus]GGO48370.1 hypothetical protein GCM10012286_43840 [Streptomyces lasiicapitis]
MFDRIRRLLGRSGPTTRTDKAVPTEKPRPHNLFEAAAVYVVACAEDDQDRVDEAAAWVSPEALSFGVNELACRAVIALAREHDESPRDVARTLLGLPAA